MHLTTRFHIISGWIDVETIDTNLMLLRDKCMSAPYLVNWVSLPEITRVLTSYTWWSLRVSAIISVRMNNTYIALGDNVSRHLVPQKIAALERMADYNSRSLITKIIVVQCQIIASRKLSPVKELHSFGSRQVSLHRTRFVVNTYVDLISVLS